MTRHLIEVMNYKLIQGVGVTRACVLASLQDIYNSVRVVFFIYFCCYFTHDVPLQVLLSFCCRAGLKSVFLPKMKPHTGLHAGTHQQTCFCQSGKQNGSVFLSAFLSAADAFGDPSDLSIHVVPDSKKRCLTLSAGIWQRWRRMCLPEASLALHMVGESGGAAGTVR